jgi:transposase
MTFVPVKSAEAQAQAIILQAQAIILSVRELLLKQRTQAINALRGHGGAKGTSYVTALLERIAADPTIPETAKEMLVELDARIAEVSARLLSPASVQDRANPHTFASCRLSGSLLCSCASFRSSSATRDARQFQSGRYFAGRLGLTPKQKSTGGKQRLGSRASGERAVAAIVGAWRHRRRQASQAWLQAGYPWLLALVQRRPRKVATVALANKMARSCGP